VHETVLTLPYNDEALELALKPSGHDVAAIIVEPVLGNCECIGPQNGFLHFLRQRCYECAGAADHEGANWVIALSCCAAAVAQCLSFPPDTWC
jgi:hypothetical protein